MTKVIGIDPAPTKKNTIYDGVEFRNKDYRELQTYLKELKEGCEKNDEKEKLLICWDAPLSFSIENNDTIFSKRKIEKFFSQQQYKFKVPSGISVMGYSSCPHWIISQYLLGYPKVSPLYANIKPPFDLIFEVEEISEFKKAITEVHPAVAVWLWTKDNKRIKNWVYKGEKNKPTLLTIINELKKKEIFSDMPTINNDDQFDAYIAWKLGSEWIIGKDNGNVRIIGDNNTGSFLLPFNEELFKKFKEFKNKPVK